MNKNNETSDLQYLWPTPFLRTQCPFHKEINPGLVTLFTQHRSERDKLQAPVYSSSDDLLMRYNDPQLNRLFQFISD